eukprot:gene9820-17556_t
MREVKGSQADGGGYATAEEASPVLLRAERLAALSDAASSRVTERERRDRAAVERALAA